MAIPNSLNALRQYQQIGAQSGTAFASPHRLIQMLMEGALESLSRAKGHLQRGETTAKGDQLSRAISIIGGLREGLNLDVSDLAVNLDMLYDYMQRRLIEANVHSDETIIDEITDRLHTIKEAWDAIGDTPEARTMSAASNTPA
ncbi:MAG: flagellar export chaperone FliS [Candidatus Competibacteraceae bacterium]|nr:flagellar export chaperone FliS [Candidatus Competibacteraceae bacterium]